MAEKKAPVWTPPIFGWQYKLEWSQEFERWMWAEKNGLVLQQHWMGPDEYDKKAWRVALSTQHVTLPNMPGIFVTRFADKEKNLARAWKLGIREFERILTNNVKETREFLESLK